MQARCYFNVALGRYPGSAWRLSAPGVVALPLGSPRNLIVLPQRHGAPCMGARPLSGTSQALSAGSRNLKGNSSFSLATILPPEPKDL